MKVKVKIIAEVTTEIEVEDLSQLDDTVVDIYTHFGSHVDKIDLGADSWKVEVLD